MTAASAAHRILLIARIIAGATALTRLARAARRAVSRCLRLASVQGRSRISRVALNFFTPLAAACPTV